MINSLDISAIVPVLGNTINSSATERRILSGDLEIITFKQSDLNGDDTVDGTDLEILEDAVDGYVNFSVPEKFRVLKIYLQNNFSTDDFPIILDDLAITATSTVDSSTIQFTITDYRIGLIIRPGDSVSLSGSFDTGVFLVDTKQIDSTGLIVTLTLKNIDDTMPSFIGESAIPFSITSGKATNLLAKNLELVTLPFSSGQIAIDFIEAPFSQ